METNNQNSEFAERFLAQLIRRGVKHLVVCPGSRSQALALAAARYESEGLITLHVRVDERSAAFLALGIAVETGMPAPVIVTSGTAVLNLHPAVTEAHHAGVAMLLLTADRPAEMHGIGSS
ncbi:MAG: thiamine pyrophosphate-binding protein, partial [Microbacteriaceae bacterium]